MAAGEESGLTRVTCLGDSITRGQVSVNYVKMLSTRNAGGGYRFINAGVNGDLAYNVLRRLDSVITEQPDVITVLIGTNDANAGLSEKNSKMMMKVKKLPQRPTIGWYRENLGLVAQRLVEETSARLAFLSLPVLGQELGSKPVELAGEYSKVVKEVAAEHHATYLPLYERQIGHLMVAERSPGTVFADGKKLSSRAAMQHFLLGRSLDTVARRRGLELTTDFIHQNSRGAWTITALIESFLLQHHEHPAP